MPNRFSPIGLALVLLALFALQVLVFSGCSSKEVSPVPAPETAAAPGEKKLPALTQVLAEELTGLSAETEEARARLASQAREFLDFRKGKLEPAKKAALTAGCAAENTAKAETDADADTEAVSATTSTANAKITSAGNPFCPLIVNVRNAGKSASKSSDKKSKNEKKILAAYNSGELSSLGGYSERELIHALKGVPGMAALSVAVQNAINSEQCAPPSAITVLGLKLEGYFPEPEAQAKAISLFQRAISCGNPTDNSTMMAAYRLGLILLSHARYGEADAALAVLTEGTNRNDYRSRATYWRLIAARRAGNKALEARLRDQLRSEYPLSLHALIDQVPTKAKVTAKAGTSWLVRQTDPTVLFRSEKAPALNPGLAGAEQLLSLHAPDSAYDLLLKLTTESLRAEPEVRLYLAVLLMRTGDAITKFQVLTGLFREHPELITKATLEMLYPLKRFELIKDGATNLDPFLVISLIRQESAFNANARSRVGAMGLMQVMPGTAKLVERKVPKKRLLDPETNIRIGVKYFSGLIDRYEGDAELALAAYNAGPHRVDEWKQRYPVEDRLLFLDLIPFRETREYVASIVRNYYWYLKLYAEHGPAAPEKPGSSARMPSMANKLPGAPKGVDSI